MKNIFVVDDDINIGNMLEELLTREGYRVTRAYSGTEALLVLSSVRPDLVLLDLMLARIAVQLRNAAVSGAGMKLEYKDIVLDTGMHSVCVCGQVVHLTKTEYAILKLLMQNPSQVITKTLLLERISEDTPDCMESSLRVHISNLRKKLRDTGGRDYIESVWGIGFKMN